MKSAYELAMERLGGTLRDYTDEQKEELAEIDRLADAKIAQARFDAKARRNEAPNDPQQTKQINDDLVIQIRSIEARREREKDKLRAAFDNADDGTAKETPDSD